MIDPLQHLRHKVTEARPNTPDRRTRDLYRRDLRPEVHDDRRGEDCSFL